MSSDMPAVVLMGLKHSGKSTLGQQLASDLGIDFLDLDHVIETIHRPDASTSCREIYRYHGKHYFLELEAEAAKKVAATLESSPAVVALGGGTGENDAAMALLAGAGLFVYLEETEARLFERIMARGRPAFLPEETAEAEFHRIFEVRHRCYLRYADLIVKIDGRSLDEAYLLLHTIVVEHIDAR